MKKIILGALLVVAPVTALNAMTVATFLQKADALKKKGPLALFSGDLKLLKGEAQKAGEALRVERLAAVKAGQRPAYCPTQTQGSLDAEELLTHFRSIPPADRSRMQVKDGLRTLMARKFPCRA
jgi:hypothetical protein